MVGVVGKTSLLACWQFQQFKELLLAQEMELSSIYQSYLKYAEIL